MKVHVEASRNGHDVLFIDGKATASTVDPVKEAASWFASNHTNASHDNAEVCVVLGAGSGYHVAALHANLRSTSGEQSERKIVVIDTCKSSLEFVQSRLSPSPEIEYILVSAGTTFSEFYSRSDVVMWAFEPFTLLRHRSSMARNGDLIQIEECLVGRTVQAFRAQLEARPVLASALNSGRLKKLAEAKLISKGLISVRDLTSVWEVSSEASTERRLLRVLEELVK